MREEERKKKKKIRKARKQKKERKGEREKEGRETGKKLIDGKREGNLIDYPMCLNEMRDL